MTTSYTSLLGLALPVTGELQGTWGDTVNSYITQYLDSAVAGAQTISGSQTAVTLSVTNGSALTQVGSGATGSAQYQIINCTGNPASLLTITAPAASKVYLVLNSTSTSQSVKIVGTGPTTGVTIISGEKALVAWNGSDFVKVASTAAAGGSNTQVQFNNNGVLAGSSSLTWDGTTLSTNGLTASGTVTLSGGTANGVLYLNGSKVATSGSALTFDGTNLGITASGARINWTNIGTGGGLFMDYSTGAADFALTLSASSLAQYDTPSGWSHMWAISGNEQMRLTSTGLGVGTSSPGYKLDVSGDIRANTTSTNYIYAYNSTSATSGGPQNSPRVGFYGAEWNSGTGSVSMTAYLQLQSLSNNVASPTSKLSVYVGANGGAASEKAYFGSNGNLVNYGDLSLTNTTASTTGSAPNSYKQYFYRNSWNSSSGDTTQTNYIYAKNISNNTNPTVEAIVIAPSDGTTSGAGNEAFFFTGAGNLGIGTSSPVGKLSVSMASPGAVPGSVSAWTNAYSTFGNAGASGAALSLAYDSTYGSLLYSLAPGVNWYDMTFLAANHKWYITNGEAMRLTSTGLGVGTSSPGTKLQVNGTITASTTGQFFVSNGASTTNQYFNILNTGGSFFLGVENSSGGSLATGSSAYSSLFTTQGATSLQLGTNLTVRATLDSSGNLGIGTSSPQAPLHVKGTTNGNLYVRAASVTASGLTGLGLSAVNDAASDLAAMALQAKSFNIVTDNTVRATLDNSGNLGLGVTPSAWGGAASMDFSGNFTVSGYAASIGYNFYYNAGYKYKANAPASRYEPNNGTHAWFTAPSGTAGNAISFTQAMTLDASGNWILGNTTNASFASTVRAYVESNSGYTSAFKNTASGVPISAWNTATSGTIRLLDLYVGAGVLTGALTSDGTNMMVLSYGALLLGSNGATERARIDSSGRLLVGTTSVQNSATCTVLSATAANSVYAAHNSDTSGDNSFIWFGTEAGGTTRGSITYNRGGGVVAYNTTSDYRAKDIIGPVVDPGATIDALKVYMGKMKGATIERPMMIAHEAQAETPYAVTGEKDAVNDDGTPKYQQMDHQVLVPLLIAELQSLRKRVAQLEKGN